MFAVYFMCIGCKQNESKIGVIEFIFFDSKKNDEISFLINLKEEYLLLSNSNIKTKIPLPTTKISNTNEFVHQVENEIINVTKNSIKLLTDEIYNFNKEDFENKIRPSLDGAAFIINIIYSNKTYKNIERINDFTENHTKIFHEILKIVSENSTNENNKIFVNNQLNKFSND